MNKSLWTLALCSNAEDLFELSEEIFLTLVLTASSWIKDDCFPVGDVFGVDVYEATHIRTNQEIYITASELIRWELAVDKKVAR